MLSVLVSAFLALVSVIGMHFVYVSTKDRSLRKLVGLLVRVIAMYLPDASSQRAWSGT